jgi:hypothetical protein
MTKTGHINVIGATWHARRRHLACGARAASASIPSHEHRIPALLSILFFPLPMAVGRRGRKLKHAMPHETASPLAVFCLGAAL